MSLDRRSIESRASSKSRRDFLYLTTGTLAATGVLAATWPFIDSLNPSAEVEALSRIYIDLSSIAPGERITVNWRGNPVFVSHRTPEEIAAARADDGEDLPDPEPDPSPGATRGVAGRHRHLHAPGLCARWPDASSRGSIAWPLVRRRVQRAARTMGWLVLSLSRIGL